jgi:hypothetical protein
MGNGVFTSGRMELALTTKRSGIADNRKQQTRDYRIETAAATYRCRMAWIGWPEQRNCLRSVRNPNFDRCWFQTVLGECNRED